MRQYPSQRLAEIAPELERILTSGEKVQLHIAASAIRHETVAVSMRDGVLLATDLYFPPTLPAPAVAVRTPYGRAFGKLAETFVSLARAGYVVVSQDCRGTGDSEPGSWDYYVHEREDSFDFVEWVIRQEWFNGFLGACGGSYLAGTQWCMGLHPSMSTIVPEVGGLGIAHNTARLYMFLNAYARSIGKGAGKVDFQNLERQMVDETLSGGFFNEPLNAPLSNALLERYLHLRGLSPSQARRWLWERYCVLPPEQRAGLIKLALCTDSVTIASIEALPAIFGHQIAHDAHMFPCAHPSELGRSVHAPSLMITGWYDWGVNDALATWELLMREGRESVRSQNRLIIAPSAHNKPGYQEGREDHPELDRIYRTSYILDLLLRWYAAIRGGATDAWPTVIYYLMGANEWRVAADWPPPETVPLTLYLNSGGTLVRHLPEQPSGPDTYTYNPRDPTPTLGGSIVSSVYRPGSADVSEIQRRADVLTYTTTPLECDLDIVGPLRLILYASSSAVDTDFSGRLSDVFPDGRAIQLQNGILRARYRSPSGEPELLQPGRVYRFEIDMWATANRFKAGHRIRLDISSSDFPRFDRNSNAGGEHIPPVTATQTIYRDPNYPSHILLPILEST